MSLLPLRLRRPVAAAVLLAGLAASAPLAAQPPLSPSAVAREAPQLADLLALQPGMTIAEIGAGHGEMSVALAKQVGPKGLVYATELDPGRLADIRRAAARAKLDNVKVVQGATDSTRLPDACCQAIFMREVYHHFTDPAAMDASLYKALQPNGLLAVIDFAPSGGTPPPGVPASRGGHGVPMDVVIREMHDAGLQLAREIPDWGDGLYAILFQKIPRPRPASR
ncbi:MAG: methyltransferase domain-containing protein [Acidobacteriota bacterium]|nr:methyltransferase domain-containing protein [Acidobacteriota bacterium]